MTASPGHQQPQTRTTRTPAFWGYPPPPHDYPLYWVKLDPKWKEDKVKVTNLKNSPKFQTLHVTHLLKLLDKMCKYEMDPTSIVEDTEQTPFCPQTDKVKPVYPPFTFVEAWGIIKEIFLRMGMLPDSHCWGFYPGTQFCSQVSATHLKDWANIDEIYGWLIFKWVVENLLNMD